MIKEITSILNGDHKILTKKLQEEMLKASESLNYEKANMIKHEIEDIKETVEKQVIVSNVEYNFDCFAYIIKDDFISCETLFVPSLFTLVILQYECSFNSSLRCLQNFLRVSLSGVNS